MRLWLPLIACWGRTVVAESVCALVVTHNRKLLLARCLEALAAQSVPPQRILVVDNASTDGTPEFLRESGWRDRPDLELLRLNENTGGAGGFSEGIRHAHATRAEWIWLMDDDAAPHRDALGSLLAAEPDVKNLYGSVAVAGSRLSWPMVGPQGGDQNMVLDVAALRPLHEVLFIPFLGLLLHRTMVDRIGLPHAGFFLAADDVEYSLRARKAGARILLVSASRIEHPAADRYALRLPFKKLWCLRLPPWKRYYDTRNRLLVARQHYGLALWYKTIPGSFLRLVACLLKEDNRLQQAYAFLAGFIDGMLGRNGCRHHRWGLG